jgi:hypothetical protein
MKTCENCKNFNVFDKPQSKAKTLEFVNFRDGVCLVTDRNMYLFDTCEKWEQVNKALGE